MNEEKEQPKRNYEIPEIQILQENLFTIRILAGWSTARLAQMMGVSRQTIFFLEKEDSTQTMSLPQFIALNSFFMTKINTIFTNDVPTEDNIVLRNFYHLIFREELTSKERQTLYMYAKDYAASKDRGNTPKPLLEKRKLDLLKSMETLLSKEGRSKTMTLIAGREISGAVTPVKNGKFSTSSFIEKMGTVTMAIMNRPL